jgi:hypothetical protein
MRQKPAGSWTTRACTRLPAALGSRCTVVALLAVTLALGFLTAAADAAPTPPSPPRLTGKDITGWYLWEFPNFAIKLLLRIRREPDGTLRATQDNLSEGDKRQPLSAFFFNAHDRRMRMEVDGVGIVFQGQASEDYSSIVGHADLAQMHFPMTYHRIDPASFPPPPRLSYDAAASGAPADLRGYWKGGVETDDTRFRLGLKLGRAADGAYHGQVDLIDQGRRDTPLTISAGTNGTTRIECQAFPWQFSFEGKLSADAQRFAGELNRGDKKALLTFERVPRPIIPEEPLPNPAAAEFEGQWKGVFELTGTDLHVALHIGRGSNQELLAAGRSLDEANVPIPASRVAVSNDTVRIEFKGLGERFDGRLAADGQRLEGTWLREGDNLPVTFERVTDARKR